MTWLRNLLFLKRHMKACAETKHIGDRRSLKRAVARRMRAELGLPEDPRLSAK